MTLIDQSTVQSTYIAYFMSPVQGRYEYSETAKKIVLGYPKVKTNLTCAHSYLDEGRKVLTAHLHIHTIGKSVFFRKFYVKQPVIKVHKLNLLLPFLVFTFVRSQRIT